ncbi:membrane protein insertase YidC [Shouchella shacheensis]|uniref:membrane protein insertase YidC n=1 Tax=Shouchella shacheensis TaxID=1649580 RepID=UPI000A6AA013|nr:membrane protein insertase YidC [Shouchella shacheensis]
MRKKLGLTALLLTMLLVMSGCFSIEEPISSNSEGFWNSFFVYPLSFLIVWFADFLQNYGLAIIAVTILFRLLLLPLMVKQTKSMKAMQQLQPEMQKLRETYSAKDQRTQQKMQQEMQALFAKHKVNPFAGCLPLIIQMPIFLAIYHAIMRTPELAGQSFLWFALSDPDPFFILPVLAFVLTFVQQKMMMVQDNPQMKILLYLMPIMILVIGVFLPSAVILYWVVGNIFMILQTYFITGPSAGKRGLEKTVVDQEQKNSGAKRNSSGANNKKSNKKSNKKKSGRKKKK